MRRNIITPLALISFITFTGVLYTSCEPPFTRKQGGTGVGNPFNYASTKLLNSACSVIARCHPEVTSETCQENLLKTEGIDYQIGLPTGNFSSLKAVVTAEEKGLLQTDEASVNECAALVSGLSCDSPQVEGAFTSLSDPLWGAPRLFLHEVCASALRVGTAPVSSSFRYIRAGATGRGDGSDWENACPGFVGPCAGDSMQRGATYYVASGDYEDVDFNVPGTELITVKKATAADHGTETGWVASYGVGPAVFPWWTFHSSHWVIDGQGRTSQTTGHGFQINAARFLQSCPVNFCNAILIASESHIDRVTLRYVEVVGFGVNVNRHLNGLYSVPVEGSSSNLVLYGISMHDFGIYNGNSPIKTSGGGVINLTIDNSAFVRSKARVISDAGSQNVTIRNSWFENVSDQGVIVSYNSGDALIARNWTIYGNVFWESDPANYGVDNGTIQCTDDNDCINWLISNNTFANFTSARSKYARVDFAYAGSGTSGNRVVNNIWFNSLRVDAVGPLTLPESDSVLLSDYNMYVNTTLSDPSEPHMVIASTSPFVNVSAGDFHLSAATAAGLVLPSPLHLSREAKVRGWDGIWDRGAFEF